MLPSRRFERTTGLFIGLVIVSFIVATLDVRAEGGGVGSTMRDGAQTLFAPVLSLADRAVQPVVGAVDAVSDFVGLREERDRLQARVEELEQERLAAQSREVLLAELLAINDLDAPGGLTSVTARIVSSGPNEFDQVRWIDRGSADGIIAGQAAIDESGLVGRVDFVADGSARIRLVTDPRFGVGVRDLRTNETGWIEGQGSGPLTLKMYSSVEPVEPGDLMVTDGTRFPPGIKVGTVSRGADDEVGFQLITTVEPAVRLSQVDFVKVIIGWSPLTAAEDEAAPEADPNLLER